ncbi:MAG: nitrite reductase small subunit NirD [Gammaproteobacteria bacterium]|nr:nitrite reductase small subunit NirD [Gammaproteobacteria bacterium]
MSELIEVGSIEEIPVLGSRIVVTTQGNIAVFKTSEGEVFALRDECPHKKGPLSQGIVHGKSVTCPLHNWVIALDTGMAAAPDEGCAARFPIELRDGTVFLGLKPE